MITTDTLQSRLKRLIPRAKLHITRPRGCHEIALQLFDPAVLEGPLSHDEAQAVVAEPAYWSFCWASGQVLARYLLDHPDCVRDKIVLDFGSGSGVVAIAAALAGARKVYACDLDSDAQMAVQLNARENGVLIESIAGLNNLSCSLDMILAADVLYDRDNYPLLEDFRCRASEVLLADSRVRQLPSEHYHLRHTQVSRTWPDLNEFEEFNQVRIYSAEGES